MKNAPVTRAEMRAAARRRPSFWNELGAVVRGHPSPSAPPAREVYVVAWTTSGSEGGSFSLKPTAELAFALARLWADESEPGVDNVDVLRIDLDHMTIARRASS